MYDLILAFITSLTLTYLAIPSIIHVAEVKNLYDEPGERKSHTKRVPTLGGIAIFAGVVFSIVLWTPFEYFGDLQYILCSFIIIFLVGAKDDILPMSPLRKLAGQVFAAFILVYKANVRLTSLSGIFGIYAIPELASFVFSIVTVIVIVNAFNLIDGINGLSGSIGVLISVILGTWFFLIDHREIAIVAFALAGSVIAFLKYNFTPAKIFMGDTGAMMVGVVSAILAIKFIELHNEIEGSEWAFQAAPAAAIGILILPLFDTLRVFTIRLFRGVSPLNADRRHIHHLLIDVGLSHMQATFILVGVNIFFVLIVVKYQYIGNLNLLILVLAIALLLTFVLHMIKRKIKIPGK